MVRFLTGKSIVRRTQFKSTRETKNKSLVYTIKNSTVCNCLNCLQSFFLRIIKDSQSILSFLENLWKKNQNCEQLKKVQVCITCDIGNSYDRIEWIK